MTTPQDAGEPSVASLGSKPLTFGSLFAGIGGFDLGLERAGMRCEWQVEIDPYARAVLAKHWPDVRRHEDVRTFPPPQGEWGVDVICGGFPCQDISVAGKGAGLAGARSGLWYEYARIIGELRPRYVIVENVAALLTRGADVVLGTLATLGYDAEWHVIPASAVGAPHRRERIWIVGVRSGLGAEANAPRSNADRIGSHRAEVNVVGGVELRDEQDGFAGSLGANVADTNSGQMHRLRADAGDGGTIPAEGQQREFRRGDGGEDVPDAIGIGDAVRGDGADGAAAVAGRRLHPGGSQRNRGTRCARQAGQGACDVADAENERNGDTDDDGERQGASQENRLPLQPRGGRGSDGKLGDSDRWWSVEPDVGRVAHGVPARVDRLRCLGNAVVPQIVEVIGRAIVEAA